MRELTNEELNEVSGGLGWTDGGVAVMAISLGTPATAAFGVPIGLAMMVVGYYAD